MMAAASATRVAVRRAASCAGRRGIATAWAAGPRARHPAAPGAARGGAPAHGPPPLPLGGRRLAPWRAAPGARGAATGSRLTDVDFYLSEVACMDSLPLLGAFLRVLEAQGHPATPPTARGGLHPLVVPLAERADGAVVGLLRWPNGGRGYGDMAAPVVSARRGGASVELVARSVGEYVHRALVEEEVAGAGAAVREAAGPDAAAAGYAAGAVAEAGLPSLDAFLVRRVGFFPDACERLALGHLEARGDAMSTLIAGEWYMKGNKFVGWARPYEFNGALMARLGHPEEGRDTMGVALKLPWWTLRDGYAAAAAAAGLADRGGPALVRRIVHEQEAAAKAAQGMQQDPKTPQQVALERADAVLDLACAGGEGAGGVDWGATVDELVDLYNQAGMAATAEFVAGAK